MEPDQHPHLDKIAVDLDGVPSTLLWTLYFRAVESRRADGVLRDPKAVELVDAIDYPFEEKLGQHGLGRAQALSLRAMTFDREVRRFLVAHPGGTVVSLGEGLETEFWRVDDGRVRWLTVDLPEVIEVRERLLGGDEGEEGHEGELGRRRSFAGSATDEAWLAEVPAAGPDVLILAQGLLMYLQPDEVYRLVARCAERFKGGGLVFDTLPRWLSRRNSSGVSTVGGFTVPPTPWGIDAEARRRLASQPGVIGLRDLPWPRGRGPFFGYAAPVLRRLPPTRYRTPMIWPTFHARFA